MCETSDCRIPWEDLEGGGDAHSARCAGSSTSVRGQCARRSCCSTSLALRPLGRACRGAGWRRRPRRRAPVDRARGGDAAVLRRLWCARRRRRRVRPGAALTITSRWFARSRGAELGVVSAGAFASAVVFYPLNASLIASLGWRDAFAAFRLVASAIAIPVAGLLYRKPRGLSGPTAKPAVRASGRCPGRCGASHSGRCS